MRSQSSHRPFVLTNNYIIWRRTVEFGIPLITSIQPGQRFVEANTRKRLNALEIKSWSEHGGDVHRARLARV